jgi:tripartite-type tricarboxylate transporter receptor subunit TctC
MSGETTFTVAKVQAAIEDHKAGNVKFLTMFSNEIVPSLPEVPLVGEEYPEFNNFLPWGPFYGIFVKNGTPESVIEVLSSAFEEAFQDESYQELLSGFNINPLGYTGDEAVEYLKSWQLNTAEALYESGAITKSPEELGIK